MNILLTGGTGFIGSYLSLKLLKEGHALTIITRSPLKYNAEAAHNRRYVSWDSDLSTHMDWADVVINMVGENLFGKRWTEAVKERLYSSRIDNTKKLVKAIEDTENRPNLMISASAVGYYGDTGDRVVDEDDPSGDDFLAQLCDAWEKAAHPVRDLGVRLATPRLGVVLEDDGGALNQMVLPFKLFAGGPIGSGEQYLPWVHMKDLCDALAFPIRNETFSGPYNIAAPHPATMNELAREIGRQLNRPSWLRVPEFAVRLALGEAADPVLFSINVDSRKLRDAGFDFEYTHVDEALADILR